MDLYDNFFMLAGPVKIHPRVLQAMSRPAFAHRSPEYSAIIGECKEHLKYLFQSKNDVAIISGSGTAGVESVISNLLDKDDTLISIGGGKFGERVGQMAEVFGKCVKVPVEWGKAVDLEELKKTAEEHPDAKAIALCHNETSTAITHPAAEVGKIAKKHDMLFVLDGITSVGGIEVKPDEWGADFTIMGSQKCIAAPAGLAAVSVSKRGYDTLYPKKTYYLNLKKHIDRINKDNQTPYTPAIPLIIGLRECLIMLREDGLENRIAYNARLGQATRNAAKALGLRIFPDERFVSNTVTAIWYPEGMNDKEFRGKLKKDHNVIIAGCQDHIKGKVFRIGHMGLARFEEMAATFAAMETVFRKMGYADFTPGAGVGEIVKGME